jgi:hypothetical protein
VFIVMKKYLFIILILATVVALAVFLPELANGQPPPPPGKPQQTPIDGGLGILAAAGGAYAIKKLRDKSKE